MLLILRLQEDFSFLQNLQQKLGSKARGPVVQVIDEDQLCSLWVMTI